jgi:hypothetical protein
MEGEAGNNGERGGNVRRGGKLWKERLYPRSLCRRPHPSVFTIVRVLEIFRAAVRITR